MCVAIVTKPGAILTNDQLKAGWDRNSDGGGFAYVHEDKVQIVKGLMNFLAFRDAYYKAVDIAGEESPFLVHMRIATSGGVRAINTHPFPVRGGAMIHNGIMFSPAGKRAGTAEDPKSDTRVFCESLFNILQLEHVVKASAGIRKAIGSGNKLAFLYDTGEYHIVGEDLGYWDDDIWFSNGSCRISTPAGRAS